MIKRPYIHFEDPMHLALIWRALRAIGCFRDKRDETYESGINSLYDSIRSEPGRIYLTVQDDGKTFLREQKQIDEAFRPLVRVNSVAHMITYLKRPGTQLEGTLHSHEAAALPAPPTINPYAAFEITV